MFLTQFKTKLKLRMPLFDLLSVWLCFCPILLSSHLYAHLGVRQGDEPSGNCLSESWSSAGLTLHPSSWQSDMWHCHAKKRAGVCEWMHEQEGSSSGFDNVNCHRSHAVKGGTWATYVKWWDIPGSTHFFHSFGHSYASHPTIWDKCMDW